MRFQVPQFIDVEDKIFGPFTFKQFLYLAGSAGMIFVILRIFPKLIAIPLIIVVATLGLMLAFYKVNNQPFVRLLESMFQFSIHSKLYLWKKDANAKPKGQKDVFHYKQMEVPDIGAGKLKNLSRDVEIKGNEDKNEG